MSEKLIALLLAIALLASALGVVYARHESRRLFVALKALEAERDELDNEWSKLQIEQSFWSGHARVESAARERLGMYPPAPSEVVMIEQ